jgi:hypothetical protein
VRIATPGPKQAIERARVLDEFDRALIESTRSRKPGCGKVRYGDRKAAQTEINSLRHRDQRTSKHHRRGRRGRVKALRAYACPDCNGWHITKQV